MAVADSLEAFAREGGSERSSVGARRRAFDKQVERNAIDYVEEYAYRELGVSSILDRQSDKCEVDCCAG